jgi:hypothetical protein
MKMYCERVLCMSNHQKIEVESDKIKFKAKHIKEFVENGYTHEEMAIKYGLSTSQIRRQLARFMPTIVYDENELYSEFEEYIKRNHYMKFFNDLEISESARIKMIKGLPVFAENLLKLLKFFAVRYEIKVEEIGGSKNSIEYPKYVIKLPKFSNRSVGSRTVKKSFSRSVEDDYDALRKARERELRSLHEMIGVRRKTLLEVLKRKGHGVEFINQVLEIADEMCIEVSEFSIKCEKYGVGNKILDNIAKKRVSQY